MQSAVGAGECEFGRMLIEDQITIEVSARMERIFIESRFHRQVRALARAGREAKKICRPGRIEMPVAAERAGQRIGLGRESDIIELVGAVHLPDRRRRGCRR